MSKQSPSAIVSFSFVGRCRQQYNVVFYPPPSPLFAEDICFEKEKDKCSITSKCRPTFDDVWLERPSTPVTNITYRRISRRVTTALPLVARPRKRSTSRATFRYRNVDSGIFSFCSTTSRDSAHSLVGYVALGGPSKQSAFGIPNERSLYKCRRRPALDSGKGQIINCVFTKIVV